VTYFVQVGRQAYHDHAARSGGSEQSLFRELAEGYVRLLDVLLTIREANADRPCIDGLNAYQLWRETGSHHGWQVLRQLTPALPASATHALH
jgi:phosphodiesterase/alkaline phosphatase D-like protein